MKDIIIEMMNKAEDEQDFDLAKIAKNLIDELVGTYNIPSEWQDIGKEISESYDKNSWIYKAMDLWEYECPNNDEIDEEDIEMGGNY